MDVVGDTFGALRKLPVLAINCGACRENLYRLVETRISGARVVRELDTLARIYGKPVCFIRDNGTLVYELGDPDTGEQKPGRSAMH